MMGGSPACVYCPEPSFSVLLILAVCLSGGILTASVRITFFGCGSCFVLPGASVLDIFLMFSRQFDTMARQLL